MRSYRQYCGLAAALDAVGERWTLLVVRELLIGPRRYGELLADLPGMGTNLLAERLKSLSHLGIVTKDEQVYTLTERGRGLMGAVRELTRWGLAGMDEPDEDSICRAHWALGGLGAAADASRVPGLAESYEFHIDDEIFHLKVSGGVARARRGPADQPAMTMTTDAKTFVRLGSDKYTARDAQAEGRLTITGDPEAARRCAKVLGMGGES
ncbi:winged helix-turn-helix transcriptional regulator [Allokutzneria sp. A3M-2-11 16]|uniref:winged helix-turn-helix transcriptional regulator n=1 Tax=Allokutzneria sp. A3M-2-11 16 TaxID=2962043 RepID=UPI0020B8CAD4|nr:winged helix-turn-helix transcriptional regulator [Allokutzneria sp. A3M-2-11 16]MCP3802728.1 winged helix-turn-helix transcriptional regulator [Allokutzneria sp. A3M-2-11 16]